MSMMTPELRREIQDEVKRQVNVILNGEAGNTDPAKYTETIQNLFPGMPGITNRPVMHPYGFVSRAVQGTLSVVARVGEHFGNRVVLGHRDKGRPTDIDEGETALYNKFGQRVYLKNGKVLLGSAAADQPVVLGTVLVEFTTELLTQLDTLLQKLQTPLQLTTTPGNPTAPEPGFVAAVVQVQQALAQAKSTYVTTADTNIISQEVFAERKGGSGGT